MSHVTESTADTVWRFVGTFLKIVLVLGLLAAIAFAWVVWQFAQSFPEIHPVPAPVAWVTREVVLTTEEPVVRGRLVLTATSVPTGSLRVGLSVGTPTGAGGAAAGALLTGPDVLMSSDVALTSRGCHAPCELELQATWDCDPGACRLVAGLDLELAADSVGEAGRVTIGLSGGVAANLVEALPPGLGAAIELGSDVAPEAS